MVNLDAALFHHFLELSIADWIGHIPADASEDHVTFKMAALELDHRAVPLDPFPAIIREASAKQNLRHVWTPASAQEKSSGWLWRVVGC
jgi:hypothetical protein